jgi:glycosyltransferase involved in cell wall biosynthesis
VRVVHNGVATDFRPVEDGVRLQAVRERYGLPKRFVLCVGNLNPHKNVLGLLAAFPRVRQHEDVELVVVGESARRDPKVRAVRDAIAAAAHVHHVPHVPHEQLPALYSLAEVYVTPSLYEGFGLTPLEAMACGTPVVAARTSSLPEVLGDAARWCDPRDPAGIAAALLELLADPGRREAYVGLGLERARLYSWRRAAQQTLDVYREALTG